MSVVIVDYGSGNLHSARKAFEAAARMGASATAVTLSNDPDVVLKAERIVLPGVGSFADCRRGLDAIDGLVEAMNEAVVKRGVPFFGICVGMQLMATRGLEHQVTAGLDWIAGDVVALAPADPMLKIPHMGWNTLQPVTKHALLDDVPLGPTGLHAYFVHSYQFQPHDRRMVLAQTEYGGPVTAMVGRDNIVGTQFHPEKSQKLGLQLISNFLRWRP